MSPFRKRIRNVEVEQSKISNDDSSGSKTCSQDGVLQDNSFFGGTEKLNGATIVRTFQNDSYCKGSPIAIQNNDVHETIDPCTGSMLNSSICNEDCESNIARICIENGVSRNVPDPKNDGQAFVQLPPSCLGQEQLFSERMLLGPNIPVIDEFPGNESDEDVHEIITGDITHSDERLARRRSNEQPVIPHQLHRYKDCNKSRVVIQEIAGTAPNDTNTVDGDCDGNAGPRPAVDPGYSSSHKDAHRIYETRTFIKPEHMDTTNAFCKADPAEIAESQISSDARQSGHNDSSCDSHRLIPHYMRLCDLKFRVYDTGNLQMILYNTFSININMDATARKKKEFQTSSGKIIQDESFTVQSEASSAVDGIDISEDQERIPKPHTFTASIPTNKDKCKYSTLSENTKSHSDDSKENLDPSTTIPCKVASSNLMIVSVPEIDDGTAANYVSCESNTSNFSSVSNTVCNVNQTLGQNGSAFSTVNEDYNSYKPVAENTDNKRYTDVEKSSANSVEFDSSHTNADRSVKRVLRGKAKDSVIQSVTDDFNARSIWHMKQSSLSCQGYSPSASNSQRRSSRNINIVASSAQNVCFDYVSSSTNEKSNIRKITKNNADHTMKSVEYTRSSRKSANSTAVSNSRNKIGTRLRISIDLKKIRNLLDAKPNIFVQREEIRENRHDCVKKLNGMTEMINLRTRHITKSVINTSEYIRTFKYDSAKEEIVEFTNNQAKSSDKFRSKETVENSNNQKRSLKLSRRHFEKHCVFDR